eukprot:768578-Hanusia_phi.AAC.8
MLRDEQELEEMLIVSELHRVYQLAASLVQPDKNGCGMGGWGAGPEATCSDEVHVLRPDAVGEASDAGEEMLTIEVLP